MLYRKLLNWWIKKLHESHIESDIRLFLFSRSNLFHLVESTTVPSSSKPYNKENHFFFRAVAIRHFSWMNDLLSATISATDRAPGAVNPPSLLQSFPLLETSKTPPGTLLELHLPPVANDVHPNINVVPRGILDKSWQFQRHCRCFHLEKCKNVASVPVHEESRKKRALSAIERREALGRTAFLCVPLAYTRGWVKISP